MMQVRCRPCGKKGRGPMIWSCINGDSSGGRPRACTPAKQIFAASGAGLQSLATLYFVILYVLEAAERAALQLSASNAGSFVPSETVAKMAQELATFRITDAGR